MAAMIAQSLTNYLTGLPWPPELLTVVIGMLPVLEIRAAIPVGHGLLGLSWFSAFVWGYVGSFIPGLVILYATDPALQFCNRHNRTCHRLIGGLLDHTRRHFAHHHARFGQLFVLVVTAIPLPGFGIWSGSLAAAVFGVEKRLALKLMAIGNLAASVAVLLVSMGLIGAFAAS